MVFPLVFGWSREDTAQNVFVVRPPFFPFFDQEEESYWLFGRFGGAFCLCLLAVLGWRFLQLLIQDI